MAEDSATPTPGCMACLQCSRPSVSFAARPPPKSPESRLASSRVWAFTSRPRPVLCFPIIGSDSNRQKAAQMSSLSRSSRGRPADPDLENRVYGATLALYREVGWGGFSLDVVARRARVGKAALYTRWGSKETLIAAALTNLVHTVPALGTTGSLRSDLLQLATSI